MDVKTANGAGVAALSGMMPSWFYGTPVATTGNTARYGVKEYTAGNTATVVNSGIVSTTGTGVNAIEARSIGGIQTGSGVATVAITGGSISTNGPRSNGILALSLAEDADDGDGNSAAGANNVVVTQISPLDRTQVANGNVSIRTAGDNSVGILAVSQGGSGGDGYSPVFGSGKSGGDGGAGGSVTVSGNWDIVTAGKNSAGIIGLSAGGLAGSGGAGGGFGSGGSGGAGAAGGSVTIDVGGSIQTSGSDSYGILAQSIGGKGGNGADSNYGIFVGSGGGGGSAGGGGAVSVTNRALISTRGMSSHGILAQSIGGGGGAGGSAGALVAFGAGGLGGGNGGTVTVNNSGGITTTGWGSSGIVAQSIGGGGGDGGNARGAGSVGGAGAATSNGAAVVVNSTGTIHTYSQQSLGILGQSIGGGGGNGGSSGGILSVGGSGGGGGTGGTVALNVAGTVATDYHNSAAIVAQSIGGGGGNGGGAYSAGPNVAVAVGGSGGKGGGASTVSINSTAATNVYTWGDNSMGVLAQSVGGGGGNGGNAISVSAGGTAASVALGGSGGDGGVPYIAGIEFKGAVTTRGSDASGIQSQSIGGGGGNGGYAVAGALGTGSGLSVALGVGGSGGGGGGASGAYAGSTGNVVTTGDRSMGIISQSIGGGGGNGGVGIGAAVSAAGYGSLGIGVGGKGGAGGWGWWAASTSTGNVCTGNRCIDGAGAAQTSGTGAVGILVQSIGGGGGNGGAGGALALGSGSSVSLGLGGTGGAGGGAWTATLSSTGNVTTWGDSAAGLQSQSIGGGGGNGGMSLAFSGGTTGALGVSLGGNGGSGATANTASIVSKGTVVTHGENSFGILAQSIGGGGGSGGMSLAGSVGRFGAASVSLGGKGGTGNNAGLAYFESNGTLRNANGTFSIGATPAATNTIPADGSLTVSTDGKNASGLVAQSIGGGGGTGGIAGSIALGVGSTSGSFTAAVGGSGGAGGNGSTAGGVSFDNIATKGEGAAGVVVQSIGGGGGNGGFGAALSIDASSKGVSGSVAIGGSGGSAGDAGSATLWSFGSIRTAGNNADGVKVESIGGGGGDGGMAISGSVGNLSTTPGKKTLQVGFSAGGMAGGGGNADAVFVGRVGDILTLGDYSRGINAQSIGGGGGNGGLAVSGTLGGSDTKNISIGLGGSGGNGGSGSYVTVNTYPGGTYWGDPANKGSIVTLGDHAQAIFAQSVGGGGGSGGAAITGDIGTGSSTKAVEVALSLGGSGGAGGSGGTVRVNNSQTLVTLGNAADGVYAQSIGGGGGDGGLSFSATLSKSAPNAGSKNVSATFTLGGNGGSGNTGGSVNVVQAGTIVTFGDAAMGINAQSIGGGGGNGGAGDSFSFNRDASKDANASASNGKTSPAGDASRNRSLSVAVGGSGGGGNHGGAVNVNNSGAITTFGTASHGIGAQSIGGGGGHGGNAATGLDALEDAGYQLAGVVGVPLDKIAALNDRIKTTVADLAGKALIPNSVVNGFIKKVETYPGKKLQDSYNANTNSGNSTSFDLALGGNGGSGSNGGTVTVTNSGVITTTGLSADGIFAQSIGGGGGTGGSGEGGSGGKGVNVGGGGGATGNGGNVTVTNTSTGKISTVSDFSNAIAAQSIGGGGGDGGSSNSAKVTIGGSGGSSGNGGTVSVDNDAVLLTLGHKAAGIMAQSIGGGGGNGGLANGGTDKGYSVTLGGSGASSGSGGTVSIDNSGAISTYGTASDAILVQSIGAGGGNGGDAEAGTASKVKTGQKATSSKNVAIGGSQGSSGNGGTVTVVNSGALYTDDTASIGINAQSIGGGGGSGGSAFGRSRSLLSGTAQVNKSLSFALGGSAGAGGNGGRVSITNSGAITTAGNEAAAISSISIGGGGGSGGAASAGKLEELKITTGDVKTYGLGGSGGAGGNGGIVTVNNTGALTTSGDVSSAIMASSIGGGGGYMQAVPTATLGWGISTADIAKLSKDGKTYTTSGDAAAVTVNNGSAGAISTTGIASYGILAQSIGGGGGFVGYVSGDATLGATSVISANAANVAISNDGVISTKGTFAHGIVSQSIGGGGGVIAYNSASGKLTTAGGKGNSGQVSVTNTAAITTTGDNAHGIIAQANAGGGGLVGGTLYGPVAAGNADQVTIKNTGNIAVSGAGSSAIIASSRGGTANGGVTINNSGTALATGATASGGGPTSISVQGAGQVQITNAAAGLIDAHLTNRLGTAVSVTGASSSFVNNYGTMSGSVILSGSSMSMYNWAGAVFNAGDSIDLGGNGTLRNAGGTMQIGLSGTVSTTTINGHFVQWNNGTLVTDLQAGTAVKGTSDKLVVTGIANVAGRIVPNLSFSSFTAKESFTVLTAAGGVNSQLTIADMNAIHYSLAYPSTKEVQVTAQLALPQNASTQQQRDVLNIVLGVFEGSPTPTATAFANMMATSPLSSTIKVLNQLSPAAASAISGGKSLSASALAEAMKSCPVKDGPAAFMDEGQCVWAKPLARSTHRDGTDSAHGLDEEVQGITGGVQVKLQDNLWGGVALGYEDRQSESEHGAVSDGGWTHGGVIVKSRMENWQLAGILDGGYGIVDTDRLIAIPGYPLIAHGTQDIAYGSVRGRVAYGFDFGDWYAKPMIELGATYERAFGFEEEGAKEFDLAYDSRSKWTLSASPALELGAILHVADTSARPYVKFGMVFLDDTHTVTTASLKNIDGETHFVGHHETDDTYADLNAGVVLMGSAGLSFKVNYEGSFSQHSESHGGDVKISVQY